MKKRYQFPAVFYFDDDGISIEFPDLPGCLSCADSEEDAFRMAREALGLHLYGMDQEKLDIPAPTPISQLKPEAGGVVCMIDVFMPAVIDKTRNAVVNKTVTIPAWLNAEAEAAGVNFSRIMQDGLTRYLGVPTKSTARPSL